MQPVTVVRDITDQTTTVKKEVVFECEIKINYPEITLSWYKGTQKLDSSDKYDIKIVGDRHILKIKDCQMRDEGNYRIVCGPHISSAKLTVLGMSQHHLILPLVTALNYILYCTFLQYWPLFFLQRLKWNSVCRMWLVRKAKLVH